MEPQESMPREQPVTSDNMPRVVHISRAPEPASPIISDEVRSRHMDSAKKYPRLNLSEAEYVVADVRRHAIGLIAPVLSATIAIAIILSFVVGYGPILQDFNISADMAPSFEVVSTVCLLICALIAVGAYAAIWVYQANRFYLTNESVIQDIQNSLFHKRVQTINLGNVEDASYEQSGIFQMIFNYGSIRLSTEGDETTYRFRFVATPKEVTDRLTNAVEAFKNGRPIGVDADNS